MQRSSIHHVPLRLPASGQEPLGQGAEMRFFRNISPEPLESTRRLIQEVMGRAGGWLYVTFTGPTSQWEGHLVKLSGEKFNGEETEEVVASWKPRLSQTISCLAEASVLCL